MDEPSIHMATRTRWKNYGEGHNFVAHLIDMTVRTCVRALFSFWLRAFAYDVYLHLIFFFINKSKAL